jgi:hypothetical protein
MTDHGQLLIDRVALFRVPQNVTTVCRLSYLEFFELPESALEFTMTDYLSEYIDDVITAWYSEAARWHPAVDGLGATCSSCLESDIPELLWLEDWPHTVTHSLVSRLGAAIDESERLLVEVGRPMSPQRASRLFGAIVGRHAQDIHDVLSECVAPQRDRYLSQQADLGVMTFERMASR